MEKNMEKIRELLEKILYKYQDIIRDATYLFTSEPYKQSLGESKRFPSLVSTVTRFLLNKLHWIALLAWVITLIVGFIQGDIPVIGVIIVSPIAVALIGAGVALLIFMLCIVESFGKVLASLIQFGEMPCGAENFPDALLMTFLQSNNSKNNNK